MVGFPDWFITENILYLYGGKRLSDEDLDSLASLDRFLPKKQNVLLKPVTGEPICYSEFCEVTGISEERMERFHQCGILMFITSDRKNPDGALSFLNPEIGYKGNTQCMASGTSRLLSLWATSRKMKSKRWRLPLILAMNDNLEGNGYLARRIDTV